MIPPNMMSEPNRYDKNVGSDLTANSNYIKYALQFLFVTNSVHKNSPLRRPSCLKLISARAYKKP